MKTKTKIHEIINRVASDMPKGISHSQPGQPFDIMKSDVADWIAAELAADPEFLQAVFSRANEYGAIVFNQESQTWGGKNQ
jgi:hypothetical protein